MTTAAAATNRPMAAVSSRYLKASMGNSFQLAVFSCQFSASWCFWPGGMGLGKFAGTAFTAGIRAGGEEHAEQCSENQFFDQQGEGEGEEQARHYHRHRHHVLRHCVVHGLLLS